MCVYLNDKDGEADDKDNEQISFKNRPELGSTSWWSVSTIGARGRNSLSISSPVVARVSSTAEKLKSRTFRFSQHFLLLSEVGP